MIQTDLRLSQVSGSLSEFVEELE